MKEQIVIVLGNDHTNTLGIVQCLGREGYYMIAYMWGVKTGLVQASNYTREAYTASDIQGCIDKMISKFSKCNVKIPIIACCDSAALALEKNKDRLCKNFLHEFSKNYDIAHLVKKELQIQYATTAGFNVPKSWNILDSKCIPEDIVYPCIIKPLISCEGAKSDIRVCNSEEELNYNLRTLNQTKNVLLQQYIERDYEISILGCGLKDGRAVIPCVENKLTLYPKYVGLECLANMQPLTDDNIYIPIQNLIKLIGYVGVFSVEMMHCKSDGKFYFTEINLRNDGANSFVYKYGVNLPVNHIEDLMDKPITEYTNFNPGYYIWDMHHFLSLVHREISFKQWLYEIRKSNGFMTYFPDDKKPFIKQYTNWILSKFHIIKDEQY